MNGQVREAFLHIFHIEDQQGVTVFNIIREYLEKEGLLTKVVSCSTDGAPNMTGKDNGFVGLFKKVNKW
jgi:hypothetical protein